MSCNNKRPIELKVETNECSNTVIQPKKLKSETSCAKVDNEIVDILSTLGIEKDSNKRIEVQWEVHFNDDLDCTTEQQDNECAINDTLTNSVSKSQTRWWGATLLPYDGRVHKLQDESEPTDYMLVPIYSLDYDPYPEGGFEKRSTEDVCFLSDHSLLNMGSNTRAYWRLEGDSWDAPIENEEDQQDCEGEEDDDDEISVASSSREDALNTVLDSVLKAALAKSGIMEKMKTLQPSQQCLMAEKIAQAKKKLTESLLDQLREEGDVEDLVVTPEHIRKCMESFGKDLKGM